MTSTEADDPIPVSSTQMPPIEPRGNLATFLRSPGVKFIMIGIISVALLVPLLLVWGLTEERAQRAADVSRRIANGWGGDQAINGPYLAVPFEVERSRTMDARTVVERVTEWVLVMPETLDVTADLKAEERKLSIYTLPVYNGALTLKGRFAGNILQDLAQFDGAPQLDRAVLVLNINDITGIRSRISALTASISVARKAPSRSCGFCAASSKLIPSPSGLDIPGLARDNRGMRLLLQTTDPTVIAFAQALLDGEGIAAFAMDVHMSILDGSLGFLPQRLMVADRDLFLARSICRDNGIEVST